MAGMEEQERIKALDAVAAQEARKRFTKDDGCYHDFVLAFPIHERNKAIGQMQLDQNEKMLMIKAVRRYKQRVSKQRNKVRLKAEMATANNGAGSATLPPQAPMHSSPSPP